MNNLNQTVCGHAAHKSFSKWKNSAVRNVTNATSSILCGRSRLAHAGPIPIDPLPPPTRPPINLQSIVPPCLPLVQCRRPGNTTTQQHRPTARTATTDEHGALDHHHDKRHPSIRPLCLPGSEHTSSSMASGDHVSRWAVHEVGRQLQATLASFAVACWGRPHDGKPLLVCVVFVKTLAGVLQGFWLCSRNSGGITALRLLVSCWFLRSNMNPLREPQIPL